MELNRTEFLICTEANSQRASETQVYHTLHQEDSLFDRADWPLPPLEIRGTRGGVQLWRLGHVSLNNITLICINNQGVSVRVSGVCLTLPFNLFPLSVLFFQGCWWWCRSVSHVDLPHSQAHLYEQVTEGLHAHRFRGKADWERRQHQVKSFFPFLHSVFSLQSGDSVKRQPKSQCLSALVTPTFREVGHTVAFYTISD